MGYTDKMCHDVAKDIIYTIFWVRYEPTIRKNEPWYENLNNFIVKEGNLLHDEDNTNEQFTAEEEEMIIHDCFNILLDKLEIDEDEFEEFEQEVDWNRLDGIIGHYICMV